MTSASLLPSNSSLALSAAIVQAASRLARVNMPVSPMVTGSTTARLKPSSGMEEVASRI